MLSADRWLAVTGAGIALVSAIIGTTVTIETRYAKAQEVKEQLQEFYSKQLKLRILEIDLKAVQTPSDRALRQYLLQELSKSK
jgi:GH35 family endo-1,4-beta-xylanase